MGWNSANEMVDPLIKLMIDLKATREAKIVALVPLIKGLTDADWDTADESLERFAHDPDTVEAFRQAGVMMPSERKLITYLYDNTHCKMSEAQKVAETLHPIIQDHVNAYLREHRT